MTTGMKTSEFWLVLLTTGLEVVMPGSVTMGNWLVAAAYVVARTAWKVMVR